METKYCIVCGMGSTREDWQNAEVVACDNHSKEEIAAARKVKAPAPAKSAASTKPAATPPAETPVTPTPTTPPPTTPSA